MSKIYAAHKRARPAPKAGEEVARNALKVKAYPPIDGSKRSAGAGVRAPASEYRVYGVKAKTLRLEPGYEAGLGLLKTILGKPINKMVNEAVGAYIQQRAAEVEHDLTGVLDRVKAYRRTDPNYKQALSRFVDAEAQHGARDPVEGVVVDVAPPAKSKTATTKAGPSKAGPAQTMVRKILKSGK